MAESMLAIEVNLAGAKPSTQVSARDGERHRRVSLPYSYDVTLFRRKQSDIFPNQIINTVATIRIDNSDQKKLVRFFG